MLQAREFMRPRRASKRHKLPCMRLEGASAMRLAATWHRLHRSRAWLGDTLQLWRDYGRTSTQKLASRANYDVLERTGCASGSRRSSTRNPYLRSSLPTSAWYAFDHRSRKGSNMRLNDCTHHGDMVRCELSMRWCVDDGYVDVMEPSLRKQSALHQ